jgi:hypothetical protein
MKKFATILILLVLGGCASPPMGLNEQVVLKAGETKQVGPDGFEITLRSLSNDSGCLSPSDCSKMIFDGSVSFRLGEKSKISHVRAIMKPGQGVSLDLDGYEFQVTGVQHSANNEVQGTFIVYGKNNAE